MYYVEAELKDSFGNIAGETESVGAVDGDDMGIPCFVTAANENVVLAEGGTKVRDTATCTERLGGLLVQESLMGGHGLNTMKTLKRAASFWMNRNSRSLAVGVSY